VSKEREDIQAIWMVRLYNVIFLGIIFWVSKGRLSQWGSFYEVDLAMNMLVH
jgi:hypothetical protein